MFVRIKFVSKRGSGSELRLIIFFRWYLELVLGTGIRNWY